MQNTLYNVFLELDGKPDSDYGVVARLRSVTWDASLPCGCSLSLADVRRAKNFLCPHSNRYIAVEDCDCASCAIGSTCWRTSRPVVKPGTETDPVVTETRRLLAGDVMQISPESVNGRRSFRYGGVLFAPYRQT